MVVRGPTRLDSIPSVMVHRIQAYICGNNATIFAGNNTLDRGSVIVDGQSVGVNAISVVSVSFSSSVIFRWFAGEWSLWY